MNCASTRCFRISCLMAGLLAAGTAVAAEPAGRPANRLAGETSPYLLMHAHNPVDWYPWGPAALQKARQENKLIFLSIGYSSCYWCHVMERESFMNDEVAALLNEHFVCIKVDREERPDIDDLYMTSLQVYFQLIGSPQGGGWPLSMFLTPEGKPFFGGTYFPPSGRGRRAGFLDVLKFVHRLWQQKPDKIRQDGQLLVRAVRESRQRPAAGSQSLDRRPVSAALAALAGEFDSEHGGFGFSPSNPRQPKFPEPANLFLLVELAARKQDPAAADHDATRALEMLITTLDRMARGGIWDHLGGGFHRYSTDRYWHVPHFEKMLYDNGQLLSAYAEAFVLTGRPLYARVARGIADFVLTEMTDPDNGGFYSAIDAETDAEEGKFYVWTNEELSQLLTAEEQALLGAVYGTQDSPVFEGKHVLLQRLPLGTTAARRDLTEEQLLAQLAPIRQKLLDHRNLRERPLLDTKVLTAWNGLMIRGLADAGRVLEVQEYVDAAARAADFLLAKLRTPAGRLQRTYRDGNAKLNAYVDDYAFLVNGLLALHRATGERRWLVAADELTAKQIELFWDDKQGGFFYTSHDHEELFARIKKTTDSALPAALSVSVENLLYLADQLDRVTYRDHARRTIESNWSLLDAAPSAAPRMMVGLLRLLDNETD